MKLTIKKQLQDEYTLEIEVQTFKDCMKGIGIFGEVEKCGLCDTKNLSFSHRVSVSKQPDTLGQKYDYYEVKCGSCKAVNQLGQSKDGVSLFLKEWVGPKGYQNNSQSAQGLSGSSQGVAISSGDVPF